MDHLVLRGHHQPRTSMHRSARSIGARRCNGVSSRKGRTGLPAGCRMQNCYAETCRLANALEGLGIRQGDAVGLVPAHDSRGGRRIHGGGQDRGDRGADFLGVWCAGRCGPARGLQSQVVLTVHSSCRRGHSIDMQSVALEATAACPSVRHVIVARGSCGAETMSVATGCLEWSELVRGARPSELGGA